MLGSSSTTRIRAVACPIEDEEMVLDIMILHYQSAEMGRGFNWGRLTPLGRPGPIFLALNILFAKTIIII
jgi:hypothetical protein